jgi:methylphosphotriester-DNA--protein-cysteine methyltransferase
VVKKKWQLTNLYKTLQKSKQIDGVTKRLMLIGHFQSNFGLSLGATKALNFIRDFDDNNAFPFTFSGVDSHCLGILTYLKYDSTSFPFFKSPSSFESNPSPPPPPQNQTDKMPLYSTPSARWAAITTRDPSASNAFIYCVTSTKIYCRPTCPARLARRANVIFRDSPAEAEAAGYRACMRCRPGEEDESAGDPQRIAVAKACELIRDEGTGEGMKWSVKNLAKEVGLTESHFCRVFKKILGVTVGQYRGQFLDQKRMEGEEIGPKKAPPEVQVAASPLEFQYPVTGFHTQESFDSELARDWHDFSGAPDLMGSIDMFPGLEPGSFNFSPELSTDASTPATTDDAFQFLNFDEVGCSTTHLS